jgi:hypothetical protein
MSRTDVITVEKWFLSHEAVELFEERTADV